MPEKPITEWTRAEFLALPDRNAWDENVECDSLVIVPLRTMHDSHYRNMDFIAVVNGEPKCRLAGGSDVLHLDGIGGYGYDWLHVHGKVPQLVIPSGWSVDCLPKSGLLHIWPMSGRVLCGHALSSFEIWALEEKKKT